MKKTLIKGGEIVSSEGCIFADILIGDGKILEILEPGTPVEADEVIDASRRLILPGLIDAHVHLREPGDEYKEGFETGTKAALNGGVTTVLDMPNNKPAILTCEDLEKKRALAKGKCYVNYGFYIGFDGTNLKEINEAKNVPAVKLYTTHSTGNMGVSERSIEELFEKVNKRIVVHAEDHEIVENNASAARAEYGEQELPSEMHSKIRSVEAAKRAVERACGLAKQYGAKLHIAHLSTAGELEAMAPYRKIGVTCEVAPHHLLLCEDDYEKLGNLLKVNPPVRSKEDLFALWKALKFGQIDIIATDHAPHTLEEKSKSFWQVPSGIPELDTLLPVMLNVVNDEGLTISEVAKLCCEKPAEIFGLKGKGFIREGYDADLVIVDMELSKLVAREELFTRCGWSPYEGNLLKGWPIMVFVGGEIAFEKGKILHEARGKEVVIS